jgi:hypothetical protein
MPGREASARHTLLDRQNPPALAHLSGFFAVDARETDIFNCAVTSLKTKQ